MLTICCIISACAVVAAVIAFMVGRFYQLAVTEKEIKSRAELKGILVNDWPLEWLMKKI